MAEICEACLNTIRGNAWCNIHYADDNGEIFLCTKCMEEVIKRNDDVEPFEEDELRKLVNKLRGEKYG